MGAQFSRSSDTSRRIIRSVLALSLRRVNSLELASRAIESVPSWLRLDPATKYSTRSIRPSPSLSTSPLSLALLVFDHS